MNVKNINPFERHVEKIVLAVAAVGAAYLVYLAVQPVTVDYNGTALPVADVESRVSTAVADLEQKREAVSQKTFESHVPNFVQQYNRVANQRPLPEQLVMAPVPAFAPLQAPVTGGSAAALATRHVVTPTAPAPTDVAGVFNRKFVLVPGPAQPGQPAGAPATEEKTWVEVTGNVPINDLIKQFTDPALKPDERLPAGDQRAVVVAIEVRRRPKVNDSWGDWQNVKPSPDSHPIIPPDWSKLSDAEVRQAVTALQTQAAQVLNPTYFTLAPTTAGAPGAPVASAGGAAAPAPAPAGPRSNVNPNFVPPVDTSIDTGPIAVAPAPTAVRPVQAATPVQSAQSFHFYDDSVDPGTVYQYQARVDYFNPTYRYQGGLKDPKMKDQAILASDWVDAASPVNVSAEFYFFVAAPFYQTKTANPKASLRVYKWINGNWYRGDWTVEAGQPLGGNIDLVDQKGVHQDVDTPLTVVDVVVDPKGTEQTLILRDAKGNLIERNSTQDKDDKEQTDLDAKIVKPKIVPTTKPAPRNPVPQRNNNPNNPPVFGPGMPDNNL